MATTSTPDKPIAAWKMLVYITADNTLYNDAQISLRQLTQASASNNVDIVVQVDGPSPDHVSRYECVGGNKKLLWEAPNDYTIDRAQRLRDFLYSTEAAPKVWTTTPPEATTPLERQRIALILWGHAAGLDHLYFYEEPKQIEGVAAKGLQIPTLDDPNLYVTNIQLKTILENYSKGVRAGIHETYSMEVDFKIDLLGFDSCLMAMSEICHEV